MVAPPLPQIISLHSHSILTCKSTANYDRARTNYQDATVARHLYTSESNLVTCILSHCERKTAWENVTDEFKTTDSFNESPIYKRHIYMLRD